MQAFTFFFHFDDEYDFVHLVFERSYPVNRSGFATRNDVQGIGLPIFWRGDTPGGADRPVLESEDVDGRAERQQRGQEPSPRASKCNTLAG